MYKFKHKRYNPLMQLMTGYLLKKKGIETKDRKVGLTFLT